MADLEVRRERVALVISYYNSTRQELIDRLAHRDRSIVLFLGACAAILTVAFARQPSSGGGAQNQAWFLLSLPLLGFGVAIVYDWHNRVIGRLAFYLRTEFQDEVRFAFTGSRRRPDDGEPDPAPKHWDASDAVFELSRTSWPRTLLPIALIVLPSIAAGVVGALSVPDPRHRLVAIGVGMVTCSATTTVLVRSAMTRRRDADPTTSRR